MTCALVFDTETTDRKEGEIIEAAWLRFGPGEDLLDPTGADRIPQGLDIVERFCQRYQPAKEMTFGAMAVHHILPHELVGCPPSSSFSLPGEAAYLIGHSIDFDWEAAGAPTTVKRICTHAMAQHVWPEATGYSQTALLYMLLGPTSSTRDLVKKAHGALADVHLNLLLLTEILKQRPEIATWSQLWAFSEECRVPLICPMKRWEGLRLDEMDDGAIHWCLRQDWLDPYFRIGLERVMRKRYPPRRSLDFEASDDNSVGAESAW